MFEFVHPWALLLLIFPAVLSYLLHRRKLPAVVIPSLRPFRAAGAKGRKLTFFEISLLIALALTAVALARPRTSHAGRIIRAKGLDVILAIDMSGSMSAFDRPHGVTEERFVSAVSGGKVLNRLETAKQEIRRFIETRPNDRIGLIGFADLAYSFVPPTLDHALLLARLADLQPGEIGDATGIASPIGSAVKRLKKSAAPRRVVVLFTDGANTAANKLTPEQAAKVAADFNVIIHTVGIGSGNAYGIVSSPFGGQLRRIEGSFDEALLRELSKVSGGSYFHAADGNGMRKVMSEINALERTNLEQPRPLEFQEFSPYVALVALVALCLGMIAETTWKFRLP